MRLLFTRRLWRRTCIFLPRAQSFPIVSLIATISATRTHSFSPPRASRVCRPSSALSASSPSPPAAVISVLTTPLEASVPTLSATPPRPRAGCSVAGTLLNTSSTVIFCKAFSAFTAQVVFTLVSHPSRHCCQKLTHLLVHYTVSTSRAGMASATPVQWDQRAPAFSPTHPISLICQRPHPPGWAPVKTSSSTCAWWGDSWGLPRFTLSLSMTSHDLSAH